MAYPFLKDIHNLLRWLVLLACAWALFRAWLGALKSRPWAKADKISGLAFTSVLNLQLILGIVLYAISPLTRAAMAGFAAAMKDPTLRFFAVEHPAAMLLAAAVAQIGYSLSKRAVTDRQKHLRAAISYTIATLLVVGSIPWPCFKYGRPLFPFAG